MNLIDKNVFIYLPIYLFILAKVDTIIWTNMELLLLPSSVHICN